MTPLILRSLEPAPGNQAKLPTDTTGKPTYLNDDADSVASSTSALSLSEGMDRFVLKVRHNVAMRCGLVSPRSHWQFMSLSPLPESPRCMIEPPDGHLAPDASSGGSPCWSASDPYTLHPESITRYTPNSLSWLNPKPLCNPRFRV